MKTKIESLIRTALDSIFRERVDLTSPIHIERTRDSRHGDFASNIALILARPLQTHPKKLAEEIIAKIPKTEEIEKIEIAGPGFINFHLTDLSLQKTVAEIIKTSATYGQSDIGENQKVIIEFVSSNPTGPLHVGHGRHAAYGATVANLLQTIGYQVHKEYYVNDAGRQMDILTVSIWLRYLELSQQEIVFPANGYKGSYIIDIAKELKAKYQDTFLRPINEVFKDLPQDEIEQGVGDKEIYIDALIARAKSLLGNEYQTIFNFGLESILADIKQDLEEFGVTFERWFSEKSLEANGDIQKGIDRLARNNSLYKRDGATWFQATSYGDEKDRVVIRENGQGTYFASDVGYHLNKFDRGFDLILDIFGADHHGYAPRIKSFLKAIGEDEQKLKVLLVQFAVLYRGEQKIAMTTRGGTFVTLRELRQEVGNDAARFFYLTRKYDQHLDFDLELAKSKTNENPVYYIQYAYARICSVERQLAHQNIAWEKSLLPNYSHLLRSDLEKDLLRTLSQYPEFVAASALNYEPHILVNYLQDLANRFHSYYNAYKFIVPEQDIRNARLGLMSAVKIVLANSLKTLGVSAPELM